ncbi:hypothetical protein [Streptomyces sp. NPDC059092]|uniref:hypothetical protein n=1 Tax=Streptomyces sp. NPDC059092 TaxID=3346725 RepID=UPI00367B8EFC
MDSSVDLAWGRLGGEALQRLCISVAVRPVHGTFTAGPAHRLSWSAWRRSHPRRDHEPAIAEDKGD